jgi:uncharacterized protein YcfJ
MMKILAGAGILSLAGLAGCAVTSPYNEVRYGTVTSVTPHWETVTFFDPAAGCTVYNEGDVDPSARGAVIGGVAGYILTGGIVGTAIAATAGAVIDGDVNNETRRVCYDGSEPQEQQVVSHFNVTYDYNGYEARGTTMTQYQVGDLMPLDNVQAIARVQDTVVVPEARPVTETTSTIIYEK